LWLNWIKMKNLGDRTLFMGTNYSMSVSASKIGFSTVDFGLWIHHVERLTRYNLSFPIVSGLCWFIYLFIYLFIIIIIIIIVVVVVVIIIIYFIYRYWHVMHEFLVFNFFIRSNLWNITLQFNIPIASNWFFEILLK
jgi:hypothetical protein